MRTQIKLHTLTPPPALPAHEQAHRTHRATLLHFPAATPSPAQPAPSPEALEGRKTIDMRREHARSLLQPPYIHTGHSLY